jgi:hypothetical protein
VRGRVARPPLLEAVQLPDTEADAHEREEADDNGSNDAAVTDRNPGLPVLRHERCMVAG